MYIRQAFHVQAESCKAGFKLQIPAIYIYMPYRMINVGISFGYELVLILQSVTVFLYDNI